MAKDTICLGIYTTVYTEENGVTIPRLIDIGDMPFGKFPRNSDGRAIIMTARPTKEMEATYNTIFMGIIYKTKKREVQEIVDILCDACGKSCKIEVEEAFPSFECAKLTASWGYYSRKDDTEWNKFLCEDCADFIIVQPGNRERR